MEDADIIVENVVNDVRSVQLEWMNTSMKERKALMKKLRYLLCDETERIASVIKEDTGKPMFECVSTEIMSCTAMAKYCEQLLKKFRFKIRIKQGSASLMCNFLGRKSYVEYRPYGVVGVISSYNFPLAIPMTEIMMAVSAGNGVVLKPSSNTPLTGDLIQELFESAGFPKGLVRTINGPGIGSSISKSNVDKIVFTGGTETGTKVMSSASERIVPVVLELGGKDSFIVLDDADIERAVECAVWSSFVNCGQVCVSSKRFYIHKSIYNEFSKKFVEKTESLIADHMESIGSMIDVKETDRMESICSMIEKEGGRFLVGGHRIGERCFLPTIAENVPSDSFLTDVEAFGPIVCLYSFDDDNEAIELANGCKYALGGSVWTKNIARGKQISSKLKSGTVDINNAVYTYGLPATPWGGRYGSGIGTTHSEEGFKQMMFPHHIHVDKGKFKKDAWWMPYGDWKNMEIMNNAFFGKGKGKLKALKIFLSMSK